MSPDSDSAGAVNSPTKQRCSTCTRSHTQVPKLVPVPVPECPLWYLYPCFNMAWYPYSYPYPFHCTRTEVPVPVPIFQPSLVPVPVPMGWYPYPYLVPIPIKSVNPGSFVSVILVPLLLHYTFYSCLWVCKPISTMLRQYRHSCKVCWLLSLSEEKMFHMKSIDDVPISLTKIKSYQIPNYRFEFLQIAKPS